MNKKLVLTISMLLILSIFTGCKKSADYEADLNMKYEAEYQETTVANNKASSKLNNQLNSAEGSLDDSIEQAEALTGSGTHSVPNVSDILAQRKIIRDANVTIEVEHGKFEVAKGRIESLITAIGFIQESNIRKDPIYNEDEKQYVVRGYITVRIRADRFESFLSDISGIGEVIDQTTSSQDITGQYIDTESRLKVYRIEYDAIVEYLKALKDPDAIFKTQSRLTQIRAEIESLTGTLNRWNDLVNLSTVRIDLYERNPYVKDNGGKHTYWDRLLAALGNSLTGIVRAIGDLIIFIIEAIPTLVILTIIGFATYLIYKKSKKKYEKAKNKAVAIKSESENN